MLTEELITADKVDRKKHLVLACALIILIALSPEESTTGVASSVAPDGSVKAQTSQQVWFAPLPPAISNGEPYTGSVDFMDLFTPDAPWVNSSKHVNVFELYGGWVARDANASVLRQVVGDLNRRGTLIAFEANPIILSSDCQNGLSAWTSEGLQIANNIKYAGGVVSYVAMDSPFGRANIDSTCHWSAEKIAEVVAVYVQAIRTVFPNAVIGDTEPLWDGVVAPYKNWMIAYKSVTGSNLPFFHLDTEWTRPTWVQEALELEAFAHDNGIKFGMIYDDNTNNYSNQEWVTLTETRMVTYEARFGGRPDHVLFQSWVDKPDHVLPETGSDTFTHLILRYLRTRTTLKLSIGPSSSNGSRSLNGGLTSLDGSPLAGASVRLLRKPLDRLGVFAEYTVSGSVPEYAEKADVGFRVNLECGCAGTSDFVIYWVRYTEVLSPTNHVPNWNFSEGLNGWEYWGNGSVNLEPSDRGSGLMLHVVVTRNQSVGMNSGDFTVIPGANYTAVFGARIAPSSVGSGYLSVVFMGQTDSMRKYIYLEPPLIVLGTAITDSLGAFKFSLWGLPAGTLFLQAEYSGNGSYWPAYAQTTTTSLTSFPIPILLEALILASAIAVRAYRSARTKKFKA